MWCLAVTISYPDYKEPEVSTNIFFLRTEQEALTKLKEMKILFIAEFDRSEDPRIKTLTVDSSEELIKEFFDIISNIDEFYSEMYMANNPFDWRIIEVKDGEKISL